MTRVSRLVLLISLLVLSITLYQFIREGGSVALSPALPNTSISAPLDEHSFRILLGLTDTQSTKWDGSLSVTQGVVARVEPWRFDLDDRLSPVAPNSIQVRWTISTHNARAFGGQNPTQQPIVANGVIATFRNINASSEVSVETPQGNFTFRPIEFSYGKAVKFLDGRALVDRVPASVGVALSRDEQDFPAAAVDRDGNAWIAYMQFTPNPKFTGFRMGLREELKRFDELAESSKGDQIMLVRYQRGAWSEPIAVSEPGGDLFKPALAVDSTGRVWTFWSANQEGNFDLLARSFTDGKGGKTLRLTSDRGPDIAPVAATDSKGNVWVVWQAFRNGRSQIRAVRQQGDIFSDEIIVATSDSNEWNPAIAASPKGDVTISWDSYRKGDYDVYFRTVDSGGKPGAEKTAAASNRYEAYPTIAYDPSGRLWIAWEESGAGWGKDWGTEETTGIGLYQGRRIRARVWQGDQVHDAGNLDAVLPGVVSRVVDPTARQYDEFRGTQPDPQISARRSPSQTNQAPPRPRNSYPRLLADRGGRIWLAFRTAQPIWWSPLGTVWFENVVSFDGSSWTNPIFISHSDNLLDNRPALASTAAGELLIVGSSDGRQHFAPRLRVQDPSAQNEDPYNNDLFASHIQLSEPVKTVQLSPASIETATASNLDSPHVKRLRDYRLKLSNSEYRIVRGEFHRHTEISMDGGNDGSIWDAWRYSIDAASLDWLGCCDHDNGFGREYSWWITQKLTDIFHLPGTFTPMFNYERSVAYPEGHRNVIFAQRGIRTLPRLPKVNETDPGNAPDTQMLYRYLRHFNGIVAMHTSATNMGTDWRDNDPSVEPIVEIFQGIRQNYEMPGAPRSNNENDSIGGWRPKGFVSLALERGYKLGFQSSSDHVSTHMSYCNLLVTAPTRKAILEAFQKRHIYGATDDILADVRSGSHLMGDQFETATPPTINVKLVGTAPFAKVHIIRNNHYVYSIEPKKQTVEFSWRDTNPEVGRQSYYYVRGEQQDGEIVWVSPMWITYRGQ
ncbi:MAG: hypothetical protein L0226_12870 [Acidobacteria bacterium]|nr:hypothetical protein [Acidobacteriota bacterium]